MGALLELALAAEAKASRVTDPWADRADAIRAGTLHECCRCRHFSPNLPLGADNYGVPDAGWCRKYTIAAHPKVPFVCDGYSVRIPQPRIWDT
jgi:hypothetical protein